MTNFNWPFRTLPFRILLSNLGTRDLFWSFFKYVTFWWFQGCLSTFQIMGVFRKSKFSWWMSEITPLIDWVLGGQVPKLHHGPVWFAIPHIWGGVPRVVECRLPLVCTFRCFAKIFPKPQDIKEILVHWGTHLKLIYVDSPVFSEIHLEFELDVG